MAGVGEEYVYRGVVYAAVVSLTGKAYSATFICAVVFGAAHLSFGLRSAAWIVLVGLFLQLLVFWTGTLYLSIALHTIYDLMVGIIAMRMLMKEHPPQFATAWPS
jgi:membrane protease YdiL (CAAX protease family)